VTWDGPTAAWWQEEVEGDPAYARDVDPLLAELLDEAAGGPVLDLGCGTGRLLRTHSAVGVDSSPYLVRLAAKTGLVVVADVARLPFASGACAAAYAVLVLEHLPDPAPMFCEAARVTSPGGFLVVVVNHPVYTAPGSGPIVDPGDGEVLWRWGDYLVPGASTEPTAAGPLVFEHRPLGDLLTTAADAGWRLERLVERSLEPAGDLLLEAQTNLPRLLGVKWSR